MKAKMTTDCHLLGTRLRLRKGQLVNVTPATNLPQGGFFAAPVSGAWGEDSILLTAEDFRPVSPLESLRRI